MTGDETYNSVDNSDEGVIEYIDALCADVLDASSILIKLAELLSWPELVVPLCWLQDFMSWLRKLLDGSADWFVDDAFAFDAAVPLRELRPWLRLEREFIITPG
jgi:hypothetical protein